MAEAAIAWIQERVPAWLLILLAGLGTPTAIGNTIWNQNNEVTLRQIREDIVEIKQEHGRIWAEIAQRARTTERLEMKAALDQRISTLETRIERLYGSPHP